MSVTAVVFQAERSPLKLDALQNMLCGWMGGWVGAAGGWVGGWVGGRVRGTDRVRVRSRFRFIVTDRVIFQDCR
jgi:hypothetical protein